MMEIAVGNTLQPSHVTSTVLGTLHFNLALQHCKMYAVIISILEERKLRKRMIRQGTTKPTATKWQKRHLNHLPYLPLPSRLTVPHQDTGEPFWQPLVESSSVGPELPD